LSSPPHAIQGSLFQSTQPSFNASFASLQRIELDPESWIEYAPEWLGGSDLFFEQVFKAHNWAQRSRWMYEKMVLEPRLTAHWHFGSGAPLQPVLLEEIRLALGSRYRVSFDSVGFNLYRDGQDAVAWHGDKIRKEIAEPVVALISIGERRRLLMRPKGGGRSTAFWLGRGDLFVTGGKAQRKWEHTVPRTAHARPRISLAFRHGLETRAYGSQSASRGP